MYFIPDQTQAGAAAPTVLAEAPSAPAVTGQQSPSRALPLRLRRENAEKKTPPFVGSCCRPTLGSGVLHSCTDPSNRVPNSRSVTDPQTGCEEPPVSPCPCGTNPQSPRHVAICPQSNNKHRKDILLEAFKLRKLRGFGVYPRFHSLHPRRLGPAQVVQQCAPACTWSLIPVFYVPAGSRGRPRAPRASRQTARACMCACPEMTAHSPTKTCT